MAVQTCNGDSNLLKLGLMDTIRAIQPPEKWKLMVIDSQSIKLLNAVCNKYDILEENVSVLKPSRSWN
jgi:syntaxin-binding protein 1